MNSWRVGEGRMPFRSTGRSQEEEKGPDWMTDGCRQGIKGRTPARTVETAVPTYVRSMVRCLDV